MALYKQYKGDGDIKNKKQYIKKRSLQNMSY